MASKVIVMYSKVLNGSKSVCVYVISFFISGIALQEVEGPGSSLTGNQKLLLNFLLSLVLMKNLRYTLTFLGIQYKDSGIPINIFMCCNNMVLKCQDKNKILMRHSPPFLIVGN